MSGGEDDSDKTHEPSQKKLDDARKRGEVVRSTEVNAAAAYAGLVLAAAAFGGEAVTSLADAGMVLLDQADRLAPLMTGQETALIAGLVLSAVGPLMPLFVVPAVFVLLALVAQRALVFAPEKLMPKMSRISPLGNAKEKFGRSGFVDFAKNLVKVAIISALLVHFVTSRLGQIVQAGQLSGAMVGKMLLDSVVAFLVLVLAVSAVMGAIDYLWQWIDFRRKHRMSRQELMDEMKESEGDPHVKQERRSRAQALALNQMMAEMPTADVVIVNPTHYAVALRWARGSAGAPVCVAKGADLVAARIREAARTHGVPIHSDPPTARALHATVEIGAQVPPEHYRTVAAAIRFAERMRARAAPTGTPT